MKPYALTNKVARCRQVVIQNMQKTIQHKMFYMYLKDRGIQHLVKNFIVNGKDGMIRVVFVDNESAIKFYEQRCFNDHILLRKFNIYLDIQCSTEQIKRYFLKGVNDKNIRDVFNYSRPYGVVRLNTRFNRDDSLQDKCIISFLRMQPLNEVEYQALTNTLKEIKVTIENYREKGESRVKPNYGKEMQDSLMRKEESRIVDSKDKIYLISVNSSGEKQAIKSYKDIQEKILGIVEEPNQIDIYRNIVSAPQFKAEEIITIAQIEQSEDKTNDSFIKVCEYSSQSKQFPIIYLTSSNRPNSKLILFNRTSFTIRSDKGKCHILKHLKPQQKYIKILQIPYEQIDDFYSDDNMTQLTFWNPQQMQIFGRKWEQ